MDALRAEIARKRKARGPPAPDVERLRHPASGLKAASATAEREASAAHASPSARDAGGLADGGRDVEEDAALPVDEVKRRLRLLKQPATLFGEVAGERYRRLKRVERELVVEDTYAAKGGQQANVLLEIRREEEEERRRMLRREAALKESKASPAKSRALTTTTSAQGGGNGDPLKAAFRAAAERLAAERREASMPPGAAVASFVRRTLAEWGADLDGRPDSQRSSQEGRQATHQHRLAEKGFAPLFDRVEQGTLESDIETLLHKMVDCIKRRAYLEAEEVYVRLAIGNQPWPIGVTSVGIHERKAREKISFSMNGQAHVMNDEATRKYIHAFKRIMTFLKRKYPPPSNIAHQSCI